jgi:hypothetical protein
MKLLELRERPAYLIPYATFVLPPLVKNNCWRFVLYSLHIVYGAGIEPATRKTQICCSIQLSYPIVKMGVEPMTGETTSLLCPLSYLTKMRLAYTFALLSAPK